MASEAGRVPAGLALAGWGWLLLALIVVPWVCNIGWFLALTCNLWLLGVVAYVAWDLLRADGKPTGP